MGARLGTQVVFLGAVKRASVLGVSPEHPNIHAVSLYVTQWQWMEVKT